jgi:hypothetical protein
MLSRARMHKQDDTEMFTNEYLLSEETPIELPSDEEIKKYIESTPYYGTCTYEFKEGIEDGIKWMKKQILNKNK